VPEIRAIRAARLVTCDPARATPGEALGVLEDGLVVTRDDGNLAHVGRFDERVVPSGVRVERAALLTPGLVDAHTHAAFVGSRHAEYALKITGASYEAIAAAGGGIVSTMRAIRAASVDEIASALGARLARMAAMGVTTVEVKSGYGLDLESERKLLDAIARSVGRSGGPDVVPTYLALHALPPEANGDRDAYARRVAEIDLAEIAATKIPRFVDAYIDRSAFSADQARPALERARSLGLGVRLHVGQFADVGGAELAASVGARSADHLERVSEAGMEALARADVCAVMLPVASFTLRDTPPPIDRLRAHGVRLVVASDSNPGTAPTESLPLAMAFAARFYGLTLAEILLGVTREAARSLDLRDRGVIAEGLRADLTAWDLPHEGALIQPWGAPRASLVLSGGVSCFSASPAASPAP
jgi:imidazolonepropionase